jgi:hypothetical protein
MSIRAALCLAIACTIGACAAPAAEPSEPAPAAPIAQVPDDNELVAVAVIEPTPAMLKAALDDDPEAMRDAVVALSGCQAASTCPSQYGSCSSWSAPSLCESICGGIGACICKPVWSEECQGVPPEIKGRDSYNSFRVCFNPSGQSCTEWQQTSYTYCGC